MGGESREQGSEDTSQAEHLEGQTWRALQEKSLGTAAVCVEDSETLKILSNNEEWVFWKHF